MAMVINTNVQSLNAQRNLNISQSDQQSAMDRLTSGKRINSAADDAAGLQIASGLTSQIRGLDQAVRNANDGISMVQTAEGALQESTNMLQRMRELAIQSASGTFTEGNRSSLNAEVTQLKAELTRIAETTTFNGLSILDGTLGTTSLQVGSEANQTIDVTFGSQSFAAEDLGGGTTADVVGTAMAANLAGTAIAGTLTINGQDITSTQLNAGTNSMNDFLGVINDNIQGVEAASFVEATATAVGDGVLSGTETFTVTTTLNDGTTNVFSIKETGSMDEFVAKINEQGNGVVTASVDDTGHLVLSAENAAQIATVDQSTVPNDKASGLADGSFFASISLTDTEGAKAITLSYATASANADSVDLGLNARTAAGDIQGQSLASAAATAAMAEGDLIINGVEIGATTAAVADTNKAELVTKINAQAGDTGVIATYDATADTLSLNSIDGSEISIKAGAGTTAAVLLAQTGLQETNIATSVGGTVADIDITTASGAQDAISTIDAALESINSARGEMGAITNRLNFTVNNLSGVSQAASASRSRIEDADFAQESANLSRAQVLQQAGTAMLAQANAAPQQVLSLLQ